MKKQYKEFLKDRFLVKISFFIILTATMLYVAFFIVKDYEKVARVISGFFSSIIRALSPLWIGLVLAYMLNPLVNLIDKKILRNFLPKDKRRPERISGPTKSRFISIFITYSIIFLAVISILYGFASLQPTWKIPVKHYRFLSGKAESSHFSASRWSVFRTASRSCQMVSKVDFKHL